MTTEGAGGRRRPPRRKADAAARRAKVLKLVAQGLPYAEVARRANVSRRTVRRMVAEVDGGAGGDAIREASERVVQNVGAILREGAPDAAEVLLELLESDPKVAVQAAKAVLDRAGYGPKSKLEVEDVTPPRSKAEAIAKLEALLAKLRGDDSGDEPEPEEQPA